MKSYTVNEVYLSVQGEGMRAGERSIFLRFTGCNMRCSVEPGPKSPGGFDCDTEFESGRHLSLAELVEQVRRESVYEIEGVGAGFCSWVVVTGGEPGLQIDSALIDALHRLGFKIAVETNGSIRLPDGLDWITVSPKVAEHCIRQLTATEVKYVRGYGQALPKTDIVAQHYLISPAFSGMEVDRGALEWCKELVKGTKWKLSLQEHKLKQWR